MKSLEIGILKNSPLALKFATTTFIQKLREGIKYNLFLVNADQSTYQQDDPKIIEIIFVSISALITFRSVSP